jgi:hypothetical protein
MIFFTQYLFFLILLYITIFSEHRNNVIRKTQRSHRNATMIVPIKQGKRTCTVKKAVELLDASSKNTFLKLNKYNSIVEIVYLDTYVFFSTLCYRMRKFDIIEVQ